MAILLWAGGIVGFLASIAPDWHRIWMVNIINGAFSFWQEFKAEKATEALRKLCPLTLVSCEMRGATHYG